MGSLLGDIGSGAGTGATIGTAIPVFGTAAGAIVGGLAGLGKYFLGKKQDKLADQIKPNYIPYKESPYAKYQLGAAQQLFNGRMAGASALEQNIANAQANQNANIGRVATDGSTALALGDAAQGQANAAYGNLQVKEAQNKYGLLDNLNAAYASNIREGDKVYQDQFQKFQLDSAAKAGLRNSAYQNQFGAANDLSSLGILAGQYAGIGRNRMPSTQQQYNNLPAGYLNTGG